jgi:hypothetical protein
LHEYRIALHEAEKELNIKGKIIMPSTGVAGLISSE